MEVLSRIGGVMVSVPVLSAKPKSIKLVFVASLLNMMHL
jgi:hypothetical protein